MLLVRIPRRRAGSLIADRLVGQLLRADDTRDNYIEALTDPVPVVEELETGQKSVGVAPTGLRRSSTFCLPNCNVVVGSQAPRR